MWSTDRGTKRRRRGHATGRIHQRVFGLRGSQRHQLRYWAMRLSRRERTTDAVVARRAALDPQAPPRPSCPRIVLQRDNRNPLVHCCSRVCSFVSDCRPRCRYCRCWCCYPARNQSRCCFRRRCWPPYHPPMYSHRGSSTSTVDRDWLRRRWRLVYTFGWHHTSCWHKDRCRCRPGCRVDHRGTSHCRNRTQRNARNPPYSCRIGTLGSNPGTLGKCSWGHTRRSGKRSSRGNPRGPLWSAHRRDPRICPPRIAARQCT